MVNSVHLAENFQIALAALRQAAGQEQAVAALVAQATQQAGVSTATSAAHLGTVLDVFA